MRQRTVHWGPRTLDVDIIQYDDLTLQSESLTIPHPHHTERRFVLQPLADIAPERCPEGWEQRLGAGGINARGPLSME